MSLTTTMINRKFVNREKFAKWQKEISRFNADKERSKKTKDKKLAAKVRKQEKRISQMQSKMFKGQAISTVVNMVFFFGMWQVIGFFFGGGIVAYLPFSIPFVTGQPPIKLPFYFWYVICSFMSSSMLSRIFGTRMGTGMQPQMIE
jgi:uncharacterized membrane protein (DUF106 family)